MDLADDADFVAGVARLDGAFRRADRFALSGASSVPGLSAAAVRDIASNMDRIDVIETAILPGNRAPRGYSVIASILSQVGGPIDLWRGNRWVRSRAWSEPRNYRLPNGQRRHARLLRVPDTALFPDRFGARSVLFRAGMELGVLNGGVTVVALLRRLTGVAPPPWMSRAAHLIASASHQMGTDEGGMEVSVVGTRDGDMVRDRWSLFASKGDGPFIPAITVRALLRRYETIPPGARPCLGDLMLSDAVAAMSDLSVTQRTTHEMQPTLFREALGERWRDLPICVRRLHSVQDIESFTGRAEVIRGNSLIARFAAFFFRFPKPGRDVALTITKTRTSRGEIWERNFDGRIFRSYLKPSRRHHYRERFWVFDYEQELPVVDGRMSLPVRRGWLIRVPLPRFLLPRSDSVEYEEDGLFRFDVGLYAPLGGGLIVRYRGSVAPSGDPTPGQAAFAVEGVDVGDHADQGPTAGPTSAPCRTRNCSGD
ncbi:saccharopine dehydrogenase [Minwuia thermotolerans]|uniref:Saccharopine dehydrogenase n=2 Tax=Minwuia thermotolerans TaxID=2056226 RepID=A0A2M9G6Z7_9PROT|nr:saccharopine dehydrogenase [Minwuia thermotolerans]